MMGYDPSGSEGLKSLSPNNEMELMKLKGKKQMVNYSGEPQKNSSKNPYLNDCFQKLQIGNQNTSQGSMTSGGADSSKSAASKLSNWGSVREKSMGK